MERWLGAGTQQYKAQQPDPKEHTSSLLTVWGWRGSCWQQGLSEDFLHGGGTDLETTPISSEASSQ